MRFDNADVVNDKPPEGGRGKQPRIVREMAMPIGTPDESGVPVVRWRSGGALAGGL